MLLIVSDFSITRGISVRPWAGGACRLVLRSNFLCSVHQTFAIQPGESLTLSSIPSPSRRAELCLQSGRARPSGVSWKVALSF